MILGVAGKLESGKDTFADFFVKNYWYHKMAFADNLKRMCMDVFNLTNDQCYTTEGKFKEFDEPIIMTRDHALKIFKWLHDENKWVLHAKQIDDIIALAGAKFSSPRVVLQYVGTEVMRDCVDPDIHSKILFEEIERRSLKYVVIADARFENERIAVKKFGGKMILVDCVQTREQESTHRSETGLGSKEEYDVVIVNDKNAGLESFHNKIKYVMEVKL